MSTPKISVIRGNVDVSISRVEKNDKKKATLDDLDIYMEQLYEEEVGLKLEGAQYILQLAECAGNIESMVQNEALMVVCFVFSHVNRIFFNVFPPS
jgi:hypothetical protein